MSILASSPLPLPPQATSGFCQRWRAGRHSWRHRSEGGFDHRTLEVAAAPEAEVKRFVLDHHYAATFPAARLRYGLYRRGQLVGAIVLGVPMSAQVLTNVFPELDAYTESLELSRLIILDVIPANAESWFCAQAFRLAADQGVRGLVAFSDPLPRVVNGIQTTPGHWGTVYQALGASYLGRGTPRTLTMLPDGTTLTARARQKVVGGEQGCAGVIARLTAAGATPPAPGEDLSVWIDVALRAVGAVQVRHPGNHRYAFPVARSRRERTSTAIAMPSRPYPKRDREPTQLALDLAAG
ncbi:hypothetical protein AB0B10_25775 [Micromonospora arborensis]|uniref:Mom family adenine methylcarbamoylation protein n=1 Tax=Micromonospora arborensis TaxID=2116518 RepID=UPI0033F35F3A